MLSVGHGFKALCAHEYNSLKERYITFGNFVKNNSERILTKLKYHLLIQHVPEKAKLVNSVGFETEEASESIHPLVNKLERTYSSFQNTQDRLSLIIKNQWTSDPSLSDFVTTTNRTCPKCGKPSHYESNCV